MLDQFKLSPQLSYTRQYFNSSQRNSRLKRRNDSQITNNGDQQSQGLQLVANQAIDFNKTQSQSQYGQMSNQVNNQGNGHFLKFLEDMNTDKSKSVNKNIYSSNLKLDDPSFSQNQKNLTPQKKNQNDLANENLKKGISNKILINTEQNINAKFLQNPIEFELQSQDIDLTKFTKNQQKNQIKDGQMQTYYRTNRYKSPFAGPIRTAKNNNQLNKTETQFDHSQYNINSHDNKATNENQNSTQFSSQFSHQHQNSFFNTQSLNFTAEISKSLEQEEANVEEMHFYFVEFQQKSKEWLRKIESNF